MSSKEFICRSPGCSASYQRKEHLRRHEKQHTNQQAFLCVACNSEFGRRDVLRRHMQKMHDINEPRQSKQACTHCRNQKTRCEGGQPCSDCIRRGIDCSLKQQTEVHPASSADPRPSTLSHDTSSQIQTHPSERERHYLCLYFELFHPHWPFIHRGSFSEYEVPLLIQSMVVIGLWMSQEQNAEIKAMELHKLLDSAICEQTNVWDASNVEQASSSCAWPIPTYQAILLHIIFAGLSKPSAPLGLDLRPSLSPDDFNLLSRLVASCKKLGMLYYPNMLARCSPDDIGTFIWVTIEEVKYFNLALFKVCKTFSKSPRYNRSMDFLNTAGSTNWDLGPRDLQFPPPSLPELWNANRKDEWLAVGADKMDGPDLNDALEPEWISNSAEILELVNN